MANYAPSNIRGASRPAQRVQQAGVHWESHHTSRTYHRERKPSRGYPPRTSTNHAMTAKDWASHFWITLVDEDGESEQSPAPLACISQIADQRSIVYLLMHSQPSMRTRKPERENGPSLQGPSSSPGLPKENGTNCGAMNMTYPITIIQSGARRHGTSPMALSYL